MEGLKMLIAKSMLGPQLLTSEISKKLKFEKSQTIRKSVAYLDSIKINHIIYTGEYNRPIRPIEMIWFGPKWRHSCHYRLFGVQKLRIFVCNGGGCCGWFQKFQASFLEKMITIHINYQPHNFSKIRLLYIAILEFD